MLPLTAQFQGCRKHLELIEEGICSLQIEEGKQQAAVDALQISEKDESSLMALQVCSGCRALLLSQKSMLLIFDVPLMTGRSLTFPMGSHMHPPSVHIATLHGPVA